MSITEISVKRPVTITMVVVLLFGLGFLGYSRMGANLMPSVESPAITVDCDYAGASPDDCNRDIVKPIENGISGISGIDTITSNARTGNGSVTITFTMDTNMESALMDVSKAVDRLSGDLPADASKPSIRKYDTNAAPVLTLALNGTVPYDQLYNEANTIQEDLSQIQNVASVDVMGAKTKQMFIKLDMAAVQYYGVNINTLENKIQSENISSPLGQVRLQTNNENIRYDGEFGSVDDIKNLLIPIAGGATIRLAEIADVGFDYADQQQIMRMGSDSAIGLSISKQSDANVVDVVNQVKAELDSINKNLPSGIKLTIIDDTTSFIDSALKEIKNNLAEGIITTAIVLFLFLGTWRSSLIVLVAIPTSLVSTFFMMYMFHFTLNVMSLMGLSLCVGILVDDSIVILENIQRHLHLGKNPVTAAIEGRSEIGMAAIAITLCDIVVFAPVAFMSGMTGQYFKEFGLTVAFASLFSLFISFTVTPMLASKLLKNESKKQLSEEQTDSGKKQKRFQHFFDIVVNTYRRILVWSLENRWKVLSVFAVLVTVCILLVTTKYIKMEAQPTTDEGRISIRLSLSPGSALNQTDEKVKQVEQYLKSGECSKYVRTFYSSIGSSDDKSTASITLRLVPKNNRDKSSTEVADTIRAWGKKNLIGVNLSASSMSSMNTGGGYGGANSSISVLISGLDDTVLKEIAFKVEDTMKSVNGVADVTNPMRSTDSELVVKINRQAANQYGVSPSDVTSVIRAAMQGSTTGVYREGGLDYDIVVTFKDGQVNTPYAIGALNIMTASGKQVPISQVAQITQAEAERTMTRTNRQESVTISATLQKGAILGTVSDDIKSSVGNLALPFGYSITYAGAQKQMDDQFSSLGYVLIISMILLFMILAVLYESYLTPFIRLFSTPCAAIGALTILAVTKNTLNLTTMIGLIMLDGLSSKNGTLLIDYTNTLMKSGLSLKEALIEAGVTRIKPIIMTTMTMIVGMIPSAMSMGDGSEMKTGMAIVVIGGMITSTLFTPIIVPIVYTLTDDFKKLFTHNKHITEVNQYEG